MLSLVLVHIGDNLPAHFGECVSQARKFSPNIDIHVLCSANALLAGQREFEQENLIWHTQQEYDGDELWEQFQNVSRLGRHGNFWQFSTERMFLLNAFLKKERLDNVIHFENDVMIYRDINEMETLMQSHCNSLGITPIGEYWVATGMFYVRNSESLNHLCTFFIEQLSSNEDQLKKETGIDMVNDMSMMVNYHKKFGSQYMQYLPILPDGKYAQFKSDFGGIFDPASWGQFVGGTPGKNNAGWAGSHHFIGAEILEGRHDVEWGQDAEGRRIPYVVTDGVSKTRLFNLHVHSKRLEQFRS